MKMMILGRVFFLIITLVANSCSNPFTPFSNSSTDSAIYEDAIKASNASQWDTAIQKFESLTASFLDRREVRFNYAKALAGRCGYDFINFIDAVSNADFSGPSTVFSLLLAMWGNRQVTPYFCSASEAQVKIIWSDLASIDDRTISEKFFMAFLSLAKMGMYLRVKADVTQNNGLGDGTVDGGVSACTPANPETELLRFSDAEIREVITGLALFILNLTAIGSAVSNLDDLSGALDQICGPPVNATFCTKVNADDVLDSEVELFRQFLESADVGLTTNCNMPLCCP